MDVFFFKERRDAETFCSPHYVELYGDVRVFLQGTRESRRVLT
jgi:hypothetical protein